MKRTFLFALAILLAGVPLPAQEETLVVEEIIAKVNGDIITRSQYLEVFQPIQSQMELRLGGEDLQRGLGQLRRTVFNNLINQIVVRQRAESRGIRLTEELFREQVDIIKNQVGAQSDAEFQQALASQGMTLEDLRRRMEYEYNLRYLFGGEVGRDLYQSESRVQNFYEENIELYTEPAQLRLAQMVFPFTAVDETGQEAAAKAALARLEAGEDFAEVYRSVTPHAAPDATGDIGLVDLESFRPELAEEVRALDEGEFTGVVRTDAAFLILALTERVPEKIAPLEEIKDRVMMDMQRDTLMREMGKYVTRLKKRSLIQIMDPDLRGIYEETFFELSR